MCRLYLFVSDILQAWVNAVDANVMEKVFLDCTNRMAGVTSVSSALCTAGSFGAHHFS